MIEEDVIEAISKDIYRRFPAVEGKKPKVKLQQLSDNRSIGKAPTYLLTYHGRVSLPNRKTLPYWVRVVTNSKGKILKISTSR